MKTGPDRLTPGKISLLAALLLAVTRPVLAGPPFATDDPVPVDYQHWEIYLGTMHTETGDGWAGTAPHLEVNYGAFTNVQLHLAVPLAYDAPAHDGPHYGLGDTELGVKYRFVQETERFPQIGIFPLLEVPTGRASQGLGGGHVQAFLPVWLQKSFGRWTVYGGCGYGINPGAGNRDWGFGGALVQYQVADQVAVGGEIYHRTAAESGGRGDTAFNVGAVIDFNEHQHLLFSAGRSLDGPVDFQIYAAWQFTFGPELFQVR